MWYMFTVLRTRLSFAIRVILLCSNCRANEIKVDFKKFEVF